MNFTAKILTLVFALCVLCISARDINAQYRLDDAFPNLTTSFVFTTEMTHASDGTNRVFIVTKDGIIYVFNNSQTVTTARVFLNISDSVTQSGFSGETGLLGLAFHPNYENNRYFYVDYTTQQLPLRSKISRFTTSPTNPDSAIRTSEFVIMTVSQPFSNHNGGKMEFGPDEYLYISFGDGGSGGDPLNNAQNRAVLLGKILRINIDSMSGGNNYSIPVTNPYYGNTQGFRQEIWCYGLRNVWKFSFDIPTNRVWAGDVGQNLWEEIDIIRPGRNYGWRIMEGAHCFNPPTNCDTTGLTFPVWEYSHSLGCSVTGGYVYHGTSAPLLTGKYIYADWCQGSVWALNYDSINPSTAELLLDSTMFLSSFGIDQNNEVYVCSYSPTAGRIHKLIPEPIGIQNNHEVPVKYELKQNFPNPFNPFTTMEFTVAGNSFVSIRIYNINGEEIQTLVSDYRTMGTYRIQWNAGDVSSGIYFCRMNAGGYTMQRKIVLLK